MNAKRLTVRIPTTLCITEYIGIGNTRNFVVLDKETVESRVVTDMERYAGCDVIFFNPQHPNYKEPTEEPEERIERKIMLFLYEVRYFFSHFFKAVQLSSIQLLSGKEKPENCLLPPWYYKRSYAKFESAVVVYHVIPINYLVKWFRFIEWQWNSYRNRPIRSPMAIARIFRRSARGLYVWKSRRNSNRQSPRA